MEPEWSLLVRAPVNLPRTQHVEYFDGLLDGWRGPLFTVVKLTRSDTPVEFHPEYPLCQIQPVSREARGMGFEVIDDRDAG